MTSVIGTVLLGFLAGLFSFTKSRCCPESGGTTAAAAGRHSSDGALK